MCFINKLPCDLQLIGAAFEHNALDLVFFYMDLKKNADVRLAFEAIKVEKGIYALNIMIWKRLHFVIANESLTV